MRVDDVISGNFEASVERLRAPYYPTGPTYESHSFLDISCQHNPTFLFSSPLNPQSTSHIMSLGRTVKLNTGASIP